MVSSIERELKTLITKDKYTQLYHYFKLQKESAIVQTNTYYDTDNGLFKAHNAALRLRVYAQKNSEWTIKQRLNSLESIELTQFNEDSPLKVPQSLTKDLIYSQDIQSFIDSNNIPWDEIHPTLSLTTTRFNIELDYGLYALDHTQFNTEEDYELELETENIEEALVMFNQLLNKFGITYKQAETKLSRAHTYLTNA